MDKILIFVNFCKLLSLPPVFVSFRFVSFQCAHFRVPTDLLEWLKAERMEEYYPTFLREELYPDILAELDHTEEFLDTLFDRIKLTQFESFTAGKCGRQRGGGRRERIEARARDRRQKKG